MPGQPSPSCSTSSSSSIGSIGPQFEDDLCVTQSLSSLDSLCSEVCDDPTVTMEIPAAVVCDAIDGSSTPTEPPSPPESLPSLDETDSSMAAENGATDPFEENSPTSNGGTEEEIGEKWNPLLYMLQLQAPKPVFIACQKEWANRPAHYGSEYHGVLDRHKAEELLSKENGAYLVRETIKGARILSFMLDNRMYNFRLFFEDGLHYVGDKKFESLEDMVQDGLITLFLQKHDVAKLMELGRKDSMACKNEKNMRLKRQHGRRVKGLKGKAAWRYSRSTSASSVGSVGSLEVNPPSSCNSNNSSPQHSRSPSPIPILGNNVSSMRNKSMSPTGNCERDSLIVEPDSDAGGSRSAPPTPVMQDHNMLLSSPTTCSNGESSLDFSPPNQRRSTPNLGIALSRNRLSAINQTSPLAERRAKSATSLQRSNSPKSRYSCIIGTLRDAVKEDVANGHTKLPKCSTLDSPTASKYKPFKERSNSCNAAVAQTLDKLADYSIKGPSTLSRSSLAAFARHTSGPRSPYYKAHSFHVHTYKAPTWCEICHNFLWGLKQQGMRCKDCGMDIHTQCLPLAILLQCFPNKVFVKRVYGVDLTTLVKLEGGIVPKIVSECVQDLESRGMTSQGIYRVSGHSSEILELKEKYNAGEKVDLSQYTDENIVTGAIKLYLRELPIPLVTFDTYNDIIKATAGINDPENEDTDWKPLISALLLLPKAHYNTLKHLTRHMQNVDSHSDENKMSARNLATVFAPTLMRSPSEIEDHALIRDLPLQKTFVEYLIAHHHILFK